MKKLILLLLFVPLISFGQTYESGYKNGFKDGFCYEDQFCLPPIPPLSPLPKLGFDTYKDGYNRGFIDGKQKKASQNSSRSSSSGGAYAPAGAYQNPPTVVSPPANAQNNPYIAASEAGAKASGAMLAKGLALLKEERKAEGTFYEGNGKYRVVKVGATGFVSLKRLGKKCDTDIQSIATKYNLRYELTDVIKRKAGFMIFPKVENIYTLYNQDGSLALNEDLGIIKLNIQKTKTTETDKENAFKRLKEAKELFDSGILSKEEYDQIISKYKPIITGDNQ